MCFSATADLVGGVVIGALGLDALRHVREPRERALAALPLLLGLHQLVEAFVWWGLQGHVPAVVGEVATWAYLVFAFGVLPVLVPMAILALEPTRRRRARMAPFAVVGAGVAVVLLGAIARGPVTARLEDYHIAYGTGLGSGAVIVAFYVIATCGPLLLSHYPHLALYGVVNLVAVAIIAWLTTSGFASLWCAWAAVSSGMIVAHLRFARAHRQPGGLLRRVAG